MLILTTLIFGLTYLGLAIGRLPGLRVDRPAIAYVGAAAMLCTGAISFADATAPDSIDYATLLLLLGMMVVIAFLRLSGLFARVTRAMLDRVTSPRGLLLAVILLTGLLSTVLVNDVVCIAITPLVLRLAKRSKLDPVPHLIGLATAANIGSVGTLTGNPQNMIIGAQSHLSYATFALHLMPVALVGLAVDFAVVAFVFRDRLHRPDGTASEFGSRGDNNHPPARKVYRRLQYKTAAVTVVAVILFFVGLPVAVVASGAAAVLLLDRVKPERIYDDIDWSLLLMFVGLFIVVHAFQLRVVSTWHLDRWHWLLNRPVTLLSAASAVLSNLVSNVPAVLLFEPVMRALPPSSQQSGWLAPAMSSTLAGNFTLLGSVANLIVVERARHDGVKISFWDYCRAGIPVTLVTLAIGVGWMLWV